MKEIYLDIETQHWSDEVQGGWSNIPGFGMALAVTFDGPPPGLTCWGDWGPPGQPVGMKAVAKGLINHLKQFDRIITFNGERFDFKVLSAYGDVSALYEKSFDLLAVLQKKLGHRVSLESLSRATLGRGKSGDGKKAVEWLRSGDTEQYAQAVHYCIGDVMLLRDLVRYARDHGRLYFLGRDEGKREIGFGPGELWPTFSVHKDEIRVRDITDQVQYGGDVDDESLPLTRCACGEVFGSWSFVLSIYRDDPRVCPTCKRKLFFGVNIRVYEVIEQDQPKEEF